MAERSIHKQRIETAELKFRRFSDRVSGLKKLLALDASLSGLTRDEQVELDKLFDGLLEQRDDAEKTLEERKNELQWRPVAATTWGGGRYSASYTVNADQDGFYHWEVRYGILDTIRGIGTFSHTRASLAGKFKTRRSAKQKAESVWRKAVKTRGKNLKPIG